MCFDWHSVSTDRRHSADCLSADVFGRRRQTTDERQSVVVIVRREPVVGGRQTNSRVRLRQIAEEEER